MKIIPTSNVPVPDDYDHDHDYNVEPGHPVPPPRGAHLREKYPWTQMRVGDSFLIPPGERGNVERAAANRNKRDPSKRFVVRTTRHGEIRCWRVSVPRRKPSEQFDLTDVQEVDGAGQLILMMLQNARRWQEFHERGIPDIARKIQEELDEMRFARNETELLDELGDVLVNAIRLVCQLSPAQQRFVSAVGLMKCERRIPPGPGKNKDVEGEITRELAGIYLGDNDG